MDVAETHLGLKIPPWDRWHDALFLAYLDDPHARDLHLKPWSERVLGMPADERDRLREWVLAHVPEARKKPKTWRGWAAYICRAPGALVGKYAVGDVVRTAAAFKKLSYDVRVRRDMAAAYNRERRLMPVLLGMERAGVPVDREALARDVPRWEDSIEKADAWLRRRLKSPGLNVDSGAQLADALERGGAVREWIMTKPSKMYPDGQRSTSIENLLEVIEDREVMQALAYRSKLGKYASTYGRPWLAMASAGNGRIYTEWKQCAAADDRGDTSGTRTGRLSSSPNFQNPPKRAPEVVWTDKQVADCLRRDVKYARLPASLAKCVVPLPHVRSYVRPEPGTAFAVLDFNQHELRILAHYEGGVLRRLYCEDPRLKGERDSKKWADLHTLGTANLNALLHSHFERGQVKTLGFGLVYGMGVKKLASKVGVDKDLARRAKKGYLTIFAGIKTLTDSLRGRAARKEPFRTWGGREYHCEPPRFVDGHLRTFEYKMLNTLVQGSAADCMKEAMCRYAERAEHGRMILSVHDEPIIECPIEYAEHEMQILKDAMESVEFDVPMLADGACGAKSWAELKR